MTDAERRDLIRSDLIQGCQDKRLTRREMDQALWILNAVDWKMENVVGVPTSLLDKIMSVCPLLGTKSAEAAPPIATTPTNKPRRLDHDTAFKPGFTPTEN
jgi:hypothetical protein